MNRISQRPVFSLLLLLAACGGTAEDTGVQTITENLPSADLSTGEIDFGEFDLGEGSSRAFTLRNGGDLPMGVSAIALTPSDDMELAYSVTWDISAMDCPEVATEDEDADAEAAAKDLSVDTAEPGDGTDGTDGAGVGSSSTLSETLIMAPGCRLPITVDFLPTAVGEFHTAVEVLTVSEPLTQEQIDASEEPAYFRDPDQFRKVVMLQGSAIKGVGNIVVRSPTVDMGHHYTGETARSFVYVYNVGDGELSVTAPEICRSRDCSTYTGIHECIQCEAGQTPCDDAFTLLTDSFSGELKRETSTLFQAQFDPQDIDPAFCTAYVSSTDPDSPLVEVDIKGNVGEDPQNRAPEVAIRWPEVGYIHTSGGPLTLEIDMFDLNQPADTLICKVRSLRGATKIADCAPTDVSGHVFVTIEADLLEDGNDTLLVTVTDQAENRAYASTTVLYKTSFPDSDDDGDGWGSEAGDDYIDCDDRDITVYPGAAELPDGKDNDCDGAVDEGSLSGDDDGDSVSELQGDCDDNDPDTYPGAMERADQKDNNCNGIVDENTSLFDDDGDGFTELDRDCDDDSADVNPAGIEYCDDIDNNCDGRVDEAGCISLTAAPVIIGGIQMSKTAIGVGESVTMSVLVYDADEDALEFAWQEDPRLSSEGHTSISSPSAQTITWVAPEALPGGEEDPGQIYEVVVLVNDEDDQQAWAFGEIWVYPAPVTTGIDRVVQQAPTSGCGSSDSSDGTTAALLFPLLPLMGGFALRRRRED
jgi:hypothetical protein